MIATEIIAKFLLVALIGYLLGSIPFGLIVSKWKARVDVRHFGSGRIGATNILRTMGRKAALFVATLDILKGVLAVLFAGLIVAEGYLVAGDYTMGILFAQVIAGLAAVVGHIWPVFIGFKGGRGVATSFGGLIALYPAAAIFGGEVFIIGAGLSGFAALGSITGAVGAYAILVPLTIINKLPVEYIIYVLLSTFLIIYAHRDNIKRLLAGKERKLGDRA